MTIETAFKKFIFAKRIQGLSGKSIEDYEMMVGLFVRFIGHNTDISYITKDRVEAYMEYQLERDLSRATFASYVRNAKIFLMWLENEYRIDLQASSISTPKTPKTTPYIYSPENIAQIFSIIQFEDEWMVNRNKSMIALMLDSGLRQEEVCNLKLADVDFYGNIIKIHGKGNKERLVPLGNQTQKDI